jgi:hypothetical protein
MLTVMLVVQLFLPSGQILRHEEQMASIRECYEAAVELAEKFDPNDPHAAAIGAGCYIEAKGQPS